jgi:putative ABC transport system permease protein
MPRGPRWLRIPLRGASRLEAEMLEEMETHVALWTDHLIARGASRESAERHARARFGDFNAARSTLRESAKRREGRMRRREWFGIIRQDLVFAARQARRDLGATAVIVATLGLGVGANTVMFGVVDRLLLSPPSNVQHPDRVVRPWFVRTSRTFGVSGSYFTNYPAYRALAGARSFAQVAAYSRPTERAVGRGSNATSLIVSGASASFFSVLGAHPAIGRFYGTAEDSPPAGSPVAVVSYPYYEQHADALGRPLLLNGTPFTIVGVAPKGFTGAEIKPIDAWIPLTAVLQADYGPAFATDHDSYNIFDVAMLRDGVSHEQAAAEASALFEASLDSLSTLRSPAPHVVLSSIIPGRGSDPHATATVAAWLLGVAVIVLLIACANVATLLLIRAMRRSNEIAVRLSLGVSRRRLLAQLVAESTFLVALATIAAFVVSRLTRGVIYSVLLRGSASEAGAESWRGALLIVGIAGVTIILTTLAPALHAMSIDLATSLKSGGRTATLGHSRARPLLAVFQVALSIVLLVGAGLFVRSLQNMRAVPLGLDAERLVLARVQLPSGTGIVPPSANPRAMGGATAQADAFWAEAKRRVSLLPSVANVTLSIGIPFRSSMAIGFSVPGRGALPRFKSGGPYVNGVDPSYFAALGTKVLQGRAFTSADRADGLRVAIINRSLARAVWGQVSPIGACVKIGGDSLPCATIVGVVDDVHRNGILEGEQFQYYVPLAQWPAGFGTPAMIVRSRARDVGRTVDEVRHALQTMSPDQPYPIVESFANFLDPQLASWLLGARMFSLFGALAFVVAMIGFYGLIAHSVAQRRHELGIRAALGAGVDDLVALVVAEGARIIMAGVALGLAVAALIATRIAPLLFGVEPRDLAIYGTIALLAAAVSLAATLVPARRAAMVDPLQALRAE